MSAAVILSPEPPRAARALYDSRGRVALTLVPPPKPARPQPPSLSLYELVDEFVVWLDSRAMTEPGSPERAECDKTIGAFTSEHLPTKTDATSWALAHLENQVLLADTEINRLQERKNFFRDAIETLEQYCVHVLEKLPEPKRGARKLQGSTTTLSLRASTGTIITDADAVPAKYKTASVEMPAWQWELVVDLHPQVMESVTKRELRVRVAEVKKALVAGEVVRGADLEFRSNLVRR